MYTKQPLLMPLIKKLRQGGTKNFRDTPVISIKYVVGEGNIRLSVPSVNFYSIL